MTSILRGVDSFDTADAVATDDNGLVGNYEVILAEGNYTSGTFAYPNGHIDSDYDKIEIISGFTGDTDQQSRGLNVVTKELIAAYPSTWAALCSCSTSSTSITIKVRAGTSLNLIIDSSNVGRVMQIIGYLKQGVI
jgi:hypothetical protein